MFKGNMKLSNALVDLLASHVYDEVRDRNMPYATNTEIDLVLYISKIQNSFGHCRGVCYRDVCLALGITKQSFYNALYGLEAKGIIQIDWTNGRDWNVTLIDAVTPKMYKTGKYIKTNRDFLYSPEFKALKVNEKRLILKLLKVYRADREFKISISKLCEWVGIRSKDVMKEYLDSVAQFFDVRWKGNLCLIGRRLDFLTSRTEKEHFIEHWIRRFCRYFKVSFVLTELNDLIGLFQRYGDHSPGRLIRAVCEVCSGHKRLEPALVHYIYALSESV